MRHSELRERTRSDSEVDLCQDEEQEKQSCPLTFSKLNEASQELKCRNDSQDPQEDDAQTAQCSVVESLYSLPEGTTLDTSVKVNG